MGDGCTVQNKPCRALGLLVVYDTIRQGVLTLLNLGPRDPTLLHVWCGVRGTSATLSPTLTRPMGRPTRGAFSSSRQASASHMLPSPAALAARAWKQPAPRRRRSVAAPAPSPYTRPRLEPPGRSVVGPGTLLLASSLAVATPASIFTLRHHRRARLALTHDIT